MLSIKTKLKINKIKQSINNKRCKILQFIFKPLILLEEKIEFYKYNRIEKLADELTDEEAIKLVVENVIKRLIRYPRYEKCFAYKYEYDGDDIISYTSDMKNKVIRKWYYNKIKFYDNIQKTIDRLMPLLKQELSKYSEIEFKDYQKNKYCSKALEIRLK